MRSKLLLFPTIPAMILMLLLLIPSGARGAAVVIQDDTIEYSPEEPLYEDEIEISVDILLVDAEPVDDGVVLKWALCTESMCGAQQTAVMTNVDGTDTWTATLGPFDSTDEGGEPYVDVQFHVEVTATPTEDGGEDIMESGETTTVYFKEVAEPSDDDDTSDDDSEENGEEKDEDSPIGTAVIMGGFLIALISISLLRKRH